MVTCRLGKSSLALIARKKPAAPPPMMASERAFPSMLGAGEKGTLCVVEGVGTIGELLEVITCF